MQLIIFINFWYNSIFKNFLNILCKMSFYLYILIYFKYLWIFIKYNLNIIILYNYIIEITLYIRIECVFESKNFLSEKWWKTRASQNCHPEKSVRKLVTVFHYIFKELREDDISVNEIEEIFARKYAVWYRYFSIIFGTHIYCLLTHQSNR